MQISNTPSLQGGLAVHQPRGGTEQSSPLNEAIAKLAEQLTLNGKLDESSPLGKMVAEHMPFKGLLGTGEGQVEKGLQNLIKDKLGENFGSGQSQSKPQGAGGSGSAAGTGGSAGVSGGSGGGEEDLMTQLLKALVKSMLGNMLKPDGKGSTFSDKDQAMLSKIGEFMDKNPGQFGKPDSGSWKSELAKGGNEQDNFLDETETGKVQSALDMLSSQLDGQASGTSGNTQQGGLGGLGGLGGASGGGTQGGGEVAQGGDQVQALEAELMKLLQKLEGATGQSSGPSDQIADLTGRRNQQTLDSTSAQTVQELLKALVQGGDSQASAVS
jgi:hypothetical protein